MNDCDPYVFTSTLIRSCIDYAVVGDCNHPLSSRSAEQRSVPMIGAASHKKKKAGFEWALRCLWKIGNENDFHGPRPQPFRGAPRLVLLNHQVREAWGKVNQVNQGWNS